MYVYKSIRMCKQSDLYERYNSWTSSKYNLKIKLDTRISQLASGSHSSWVYGVGELLFRSLLCDLFVLYQHIGTEHERGIKRWIEADDPSLTKNETLDVYIFPPLQKYLDRVACCRYFPLSPTFTSPRSPCGTAKHEMNTDGIVTEIHLQDVKTEWWLTHVLLVEFILYTIFTGSYLFIYLSHHALLMRGHGIVKVVFSSYLL